MLRHINAVPGHFMPRLLFNAHSANFYFMIQENMHFLNSECAFHNNVVLLLIREQCKIKQHGLLQNALGPGTINVTLDSTLFSSYVLFYVRVNAHNITSVRKTAREWGRWRETAHREGEKRMEHNTGQGQIMKMFSVCCITVKVHLMRWNPANAQPYISTFMIHSHFSNLISFMTVFFFREFRRLLTVFQPKSKP